ncbi:MAG TPA: Eco57I restriction-modification methylase domain-containing protein [Novimethylophilus sp.]|uniref:Eco57I restriction-modification methylase domain-containing protein n=1 Tax=Novimethylophilus sp. TaxID=2137426 RepID=UPI002F3FD3D6
MSKIAQQLQSFQFVELFNQLGWDALRVGLEKEVGSEIYSLRPIAQKRGIQILQCLPGGDGAIPPYAIRQKIERKVTADAREHLIIFTDAEQTRQIWQWVSRATGRPTQYREVKWQAGQSTELLEQKLKAITFDLDEEEGLTVFGVAERLRGGFDRDNVTKKFYKVFQTQRDAFQKFIEGIPSDDHQRWYTTVVVDRLMFLWFLQEKFFLNGDKRYLRNRLDTHLAANPGVSFYKSFLSPLFFRGFAEERTEANRAAIEAEFGKVPYLNGGLFAEHELEREYGEAIDIPDTAFSSLFAFFDEWDWHLDERPLASGKEINPDVLGYIFEKFVNQKQMGAYYTKEDITEYIGKNTIIPSLFEKVRAEHTAAFDAHAWPLLQEDPRRYVYPAMLHGLPPSPLAGEGRGEGLYPAEIANGLDTQAPDLLERRKPWNKTAAPSHGLPTEIWRETIARHNRTREILAKLQAGEINSVADLITYNLNIRQFAQDVIERCTDPALLRAFWVVLAGRLPRKSHEKFRHGMSVLDPTCGSGAFLFAALQILKPLYQACLTAMSGTLLDADISPSPASGRGAGGEGALANIEEIVERFHAAAVDRVRDYAITKHIIVHNLYGVDIETQATEIAKLRLFLKLVALLEPGDAIEPLPDIDFNIRAGNTLVGYASEKETEQAVTQGKFDFDDTWGKIKTKLVAVEQAYNNFQIQQVQRGGHVTVEDKRDLGDQLHELEETLNTHLCREYGKDPNNGKQFAAWKTSHKPFHWYVDFYPIMAAGGFDVVIGNPPYVVFPSKDVPYSCLPNQYACEATKNLYALVAERSKRLIGSDAPVGLIVQLTSMSSERMTAMQNLMAKDAHAFILPFPRRPASVFEGVEMPTAIWISLPNKKSSFVSSSVRRFYTEERSTALEVIKLYSHADRRFGFRVAKVDSDIAANLLSRLEGANVIASLVSKDPKGRVYYQEACRYWAKASAFSPRFIRNGETVEQPHGRILSLANEQATGFVNCLLNSSLFYWYYSTLADCEHINDSLIQTFPLPLQWANTDWNAISTVIDKTLSSSAKPRTIRTKQGHLIEYDEINGKSAHDQVNTADQALSKLFGLSNEQLDYIINYDIKYRMGLNGAEDDADD